MEPLDRLESWKEIAAYLKRDVRTVQRWEAGEELPVHRHRHQKRGSVYAYPAELDGWRNSRRARLLLSASAHAELPAAGPAVTPTVGAVPLRVGAWHWLPALAALLVVIVVSVALVREPSVTGEGGGPHARTEAPRLFGEVLRDGGNLDRIPIGGKGGFLALSPDGATLFVSMCDVNRAGFESIDLRTRQVTWRVESLKDCAPFVLSSSGDRLFVPDDADIVIADIATRAIRRISTPSGHLSDVALARDDRTLYAAAVFHGLLKLDTRSGEITTISRIPCPVRLALTPSGDRLYVSYQCSGPGGRRGHDAIEAFDTRTNTSIAVIKDLPNVGGSIIVSPDGSQLWADGADACRSSYYDQIGCAGGPGSVVNVIRTLDHTLLRSLRIGPRDEYNMRLGFAPDGTRVVAGRVQTTVVNAATFAPVEMSPLPLRSNVLFSHDGRIAYAILGEETSIAILPVAEHPALPPGLTARWTLDGVGSDVAGGNDLGALKPESFVPGRWGQSVRISGAAPIRLQSPPLLDIDRGHLTVGAWIRLETTRRTQSVIEYASTSTEGVFGWTLQVEVDGRVAACLGWFSGNRCDPARSTTIVGATVLEPARWHHITMTRARDILSVYVNGRADGSGQVSGVTPESSAMWLRLGSDEAGFGTLAGRLDEVEVYGRALTPEEIARRAR